MMKGKGKRRTKGMAAAGLAAFLAAAALRAGPVKVIFDTDMGPDYDDVGALAALHALADRGEAEILATVSCNRSPLAVACIEILNGWYGRWNIPVGCVGEGGVDIGERGVKHPWREALAAAFPKFRHRVGADAPDAVAVCRRALADAPDGSVTVVTVGFLTNPMRLLQSGPDGISPLGGEELVRKKVRRLVSMAGLFPKGREYNMFNDAAASRYVAAHWPTPILFSGGELGGRVLTGLRLIAAPGPESPAKNVYTTMIVKNKRDRGGRMSWDQTAVLAAVRGAGEYFGVERGTIRVDARGGNTWAPAPDGPHARLLPKMAPAELAAVIEGLMMARPANPGGPRTPFGGPARRAREGCWFDAPAEKWTEATPLGNGRLGVLAFGGTEEETLVLNEDSVWGPRPPQKVNREKGPALIKEMRALLFAGKHGEAQEKCQNEFLLDRARIAPYQPLAFLHLRHAPGRGPAAGYRRSLDMEAAVGTVSFTRDGRAYTRETFVAYDDDVIVHSVSADRPGSVSFTLTADRPPSDWKAEVLPPNRILLSGSTGKKGVAFDMLVEVEASGGAVRPEGAGLAVSGADEARVLVTAFTDYNVMSPFEPLARDRRALCEKTLAAAAAKPPARLRADHARAFSALYDRAALELPAGPGAAAGGESVGAMLRRAKAERRFTTDLLLVYYDFCRYLLISASRPGGLPGTLQGIWNPMMHPPWESDWHLDINLSMLYWPAAEWGLPEVCEPLATLAEMGFAAARPTARDVLGVKEGSFLNAYTDAWGTSTMSRKPCWGMYVSGGAWLLQDALAPWHKTRGDALLRRMLPLLRTQTQFYLGWLVKNPETGKWVSGPSCSPENTYEGHGVCSIDMGPAHDQELIAMTLSDFLTAARRFTPEDPLIPSARAVLDGLAEPEIAPDGSLQEWSRPFREVEPKHRHLSHAIGLLVGRRRSARKSPEYAAAVRKTVEKRVRAHYVYSGWCAGVIARLYALLGDGEKAAAAIDRASEFLCGNLFMMAGSAPQVTDMYGIPSAVNDMLLRCDGEWIELLPALPGRFAAAGSFRGLCADNGFVVSAAWKDGKVTRLTILSRNGGPCTVRFNGRERRLETKKGAMETLLWQD